MSDDVTTGYMKAEPLEGDLIAEMQAMIETMEPEDDRTPEEIARDQVETYALVADALNTRGRPLVTKNVVLDALRIARKPGDLSLSTKVSGRGDTRGPKFELHYVREFILSLQRGGKVYSEVPNEETGVLLSWRPEAAFRPDTDDAKRAAVRFGVAVEVLAAIMKDEAARVDAEVDGDGEVQE